MGGEPFADSVRLEATWGQIFLPLTFSGLSLVNSAISGSWFTIEATTVTAFAPGGFLCDIEFERFQEEVNPIILTPNEALAARDLHVTDKVRLGSRENSYLSFSSLLSASVDYNGANGTFSV